MCVCVCVCVIYVTLSIIPLKGCLSLFSLQALVQMRVEPVTGDHPCTHRALI